MDDVWILLRFVSNWFILRVQEQEHCHTRGLAEAYRQIDWCLDFRSSVGFIESPVETCRFRLLSNECQQNDCVTDPPNLRRHSSIGSWKLGFEFLIFLFSYVCETYYFEHREIPRAPQEPNDVFCITERVVAISSKIAVHLIDFSVEIPRTWECACFFIEY